MQSAPRPAGLIQRYCQELQARHYARRTVATYEQWLRRFLRFHQLRHPREMGSAEVNAFLTHLAVELKVSASTQNQALSALLFLYRELLERDLDLEGVIRGADEEAVAGGAERGGGESREARAGGRSSLGGGIAVWEWASFDGGVALKGAGSRF